MQTVKQKMSDATAKAEEKVEEAKASAAEKFEKMKAHDKAEKEAAHERKEARKEAAKQEEHEKRADAALAKEGHHQHHSTTDVDIAHPVTPGTQSHIDNTSVATTAATTPPNYVNAPHPISTAIAYPPGPPRS